MSSILERAETTARHLDAAGLDAALVDAHRRTASILADLGHCASAIASGWRVPRLATVNPPLWEQGHLAWFAEWWILRDPRPVPGAEAWIATRPSRLETADRLFDSARVAHDTRWSLPLPSAGDVATYVRDVLDRVRDRLAREADETDATLYPYRLVLFHEDMHGEALTYLRQTVDYPAPAGVDATLRAVDVDRTPLVVERSRFQRGTADDRGFAFDNEQPAAIVELPAFTIDAACLSVGAYLEFVEAGGYRDAALWPGEAGRWLATHGVDHPVRWRRTDDGWQQRWFGAWQPLPLAAPVCHVNAFEAEAYCRWAGRRLPHEVEWEYAATHASAACFDWGPAVWEWSADAFTPYPGFVAGRYREYSAPWFTSHRAVRGASFATHARMRHPRYRNFYTPERNDLFIGFRTCQAR